MHPIVARIQNSSRTAKLGALLLLVVSVAAVGFLVGPAEATRRQMASLLPEGVDPDLAKKAMCMQRGDRMCCEFGSPCDAPAYSYCEGDEAVSPVVGCCLQF